MQTSSRIASRTATHASHADQFIEYGVDGAAILRYVYHARTDPTNSPKPFFHPLRTLSGELVTIYRPHDHHWHTGLAMTMSHLNDKNFWGGPSFVENLGYTMLDNHGRIEHTRFNDVRIEGDHFALDESLVWKPDDSTIWLEETRHIAVTQINHADSYWVLSHSSSLVNVSEKTLTFGSPTTNGRPNAGYGSLFWRGPRDFTGGDVIGADQQDNYMGASMAWLAYCGRHDGGSGKQSTLLFIDDPSNPRYPNKWFVRSEPYACVSYSFMFDENYALAPGESLTLTYHLAIFDGAVDREKLARVAAQTTSAGVPSL